MFYLLTFLTASGLSCLTSYIKLSNESGKSGSAVLCTESFVYLAIVIIGNSLSAFLAPAVVPGPENLVDAAFPRWIWYGVMGVFGFEAVIRHFNIELFDNGILAIKSWVDLAEDNAGAAIIERSVILRHNKAQSIADSLCELSEEELNAQMLRAMGGERLEEIENQSSDSNVDPHFHKALVLAHEEPRTAKSIAVSME